MKILTVSSWNKKLYNEYAHRFLSSWRWPFQLRIYNEDKDFFDKVPQCKEFVERNKHRMEGKDAIQKYWQDGVRFCYKVYAYTHAILNETGYDGIIGIDADSVFYKRIDENWIKQHIHRDDCMMAYLGRGNHYSECGFLYWNMYHKDTKDYARVMQDMYNTDSIYNLKEQHDSFIWDYIRKRFEDERGTKNHNIGDNRLGHVQARSILGTVYDHTKGPSRKKKGKSPEFKL